MSTKRHVKFPKITQFRNVVKDICHMSSYVGQDENGEPIFDGNRPKPILEFTGTCKLHGTNSGISFNKKDGMWAQSRTNIITPEKDNAGFAFFVESKKDIFQKMFDEIRSKLNGSIYPDDIITIYGEWAGNGIQKGVGINQIEKSFFIFGVKLSPASVISIEGNPNDDAAYWIDYTYLRSPEDRIYNITDFKTFKISIDFNNPGLIQNDLIAHTEGVEKECPVSKQLGAEGDSCGEGIVWLTKYNGSTVRFKVKGTAHSTSKVTKLAEVDIEKLKNITSFVESAVTDNRFNQGIKEVYGDSELDMKKFGDLIRWIIKDILDEEMDVMTENGLEPKEVNKYISGKVKELWFAMEL